VPTARFDLGAVNAPYTSAFRDERSAEIQAGDYGADNPQHRMQRIVAPSPYYVVPTELEVVWSVRAVWIASVVC
jgi:hypothetical protein